MNLFLAEAAARGGMQHVDLGTGPEEYKKWFQTGALTVFQGRVARRSPGAALYSTRRAVRKAVISHPSSLQAAKRARSAYFRMDAAIQRRNGRR
jgi:CelD/BcsL family acetyltransferase involved in cellulose biosynthesis